MYLRVIAVLTLVLVCAEGRAKRRPRTPGRFPKPDTWMLYSSKYDPSIEGKKCVDLRGPLCSIYAKAPRYCYDHQDFMQKYCHKSCRWCETKDETPEKLFAEPQPNGGAGIVNGFAKGGCEDLLEDCSKYIKKPEDCEAFSSLTRKYCARTCGHCCSDQLRDCSAFIKHPSQCNGLNGFFRRYCSYTCKICDRSKPRSLSSTSSDEGRMTETLVTHVKVTEPTTDPLKQRDTPDKKKSTKTRSVSCDDQLSQCARLVAENPEYCRSQVDYMKEYCKKSCNFCEPKIRIPKCVDRRKRKCKLYSKFQGYCTVHKLYMSEVCPKACGFCGMSPDEFKTRISLTENNKKYEFAIKTQWNGAAINHEPIKIKLSAEDSLNVRLEVSGPFFDKPGKPPCLAGQPCWQLWNYEVAEVFFLGEGKKYLELEVSPHGPHLLLLLDGVRKPFKTKLPMRYSANIDHVKKTWTGTAIVPLDYFPPGMSKINMYAIHGPENQKVYEALYPAKNTYNYADFHRLQYFRDFDFKSMFPQGWTQPMSPLWVGRMY